MHESFELLRKSFLTTQIPSVKERTDGLKRLRKNIIICQQELLDAFTQDFKKSSFEVDASEILICLREINNTLKNLKYWTQDKKVNTDN